MQDLIDLIVENKIPVGGTLIAILVFWDKIKVVFGSLKAKIKLPNISSISKPNEEQADQDALRHLRNRASSFGSKELTALIKEIDTRFYDIHAGIKNDK